MSEPAKMPDQTPGSYRPKTKPEILKMAEEKSAKPLVFYETHYVNGRLDRFETDRLIIRHLRPEDWRDMQELAISNNNSIYSDCDHLWPTDDADIQRMCEPGNQFWVAEVKAFSKVVCFVNFNGMDKVAVIRFFYLIGKLPIH